MKLFKESKKLPELLIHVVLFHFGGVQKVLLDCWWVLNLFLYLFGQNINLFLFSNFFSLSITTSLPLLNVLAFACFLGFVSVLLDKLLCELSESIVAILPTRFSKLWIAAHWLFNAVSLA